MGVCKFFSSSSFDHNQNDNILYGPFRFQPSPNPDPSNYKIIKSEKINNHLIVLINYPDCTNYEGNKILVFEKLNIEELINQEKIDPHFSDNKNYHSPIARFEPSEKGWSLAKKICM